MYKVTSEIYGETNFQPDNSESEDGKVISKFKFIYPQGRTNDDNAIESSSAIAVDKDGDLIVSRKRVEQIALEHSQSTEIRLVGLQVWRGALLLADYFFYCREQFRNKQILELGAGVGLTSIAAAIFCERVVCTDVDIGGILELIQRNVQRNRRLMTGSVQVLEYDFKATATEYSQVLLKAIDDSDIVFAADVIYDDELTNAFIDVMEIIFSRQTMSGRRKTFYVALEKRYVFTLSEFDAVAPMFEYFLKQTANKPWHFENVSLDFEQYFEYERCKQLVLLKVTSGGS